MEESIKGSRVLFSKFPVPCKSANICYSRQISSQQLVAIKVMDIDNLDYKSVRDMKDESIKDFIHETKVLKQAKDAGATNINMFIEAVSIHSQLWIICDYCPGGSVKTLVR